MNISDDELILYRFRDGLDPGETERIARAIAADPAVAERYRALDSDLNRIRDGEAPMRPTALRRWYVALERAARPAPRRPAGLALRFAAAAAVVIAGFGVAWLAHREQGAAAPQVAVAATRIDRAMQLHLIELESQLARMAEIPAGERGETIRRLVEQNRLQTAVAERSGATREARVLRAFTVALEDIAADANANGKLKAALAQLDFEMKVTQARLALLSPSTGALRPEAL